MKVMVGECGEELLVFLCKKILYTNERESVVRKSLLVGVDIHVWIYRNITRRAHGALVIVELCTCTAEIPTGACFTPHERKIPCAHSTQPIYLLPKNTDTEGECIHEYVHYIIWRLRVFVYNPSSSFLH